MKYIPRLPSQNINVTVTSTIKELFLLTGALAVILTGIYLVLGLAVDFFVPRISIDFEKKISSLFIRGIPSLPSFKKKRIYLQTLVNRLQTKCGNLPYQLKVHLVEDDRCNAMAYPGGHIIVFTGLFNAVSSENELASVLGHEMGHYANRDHLRGLGRALILTSVSVLVFGPDSRVNNFLLELLNLTNLSFSRKQELWADEYALMRLQCLYGHVGGAADFLIKIPKAQDPGRFGHYFSTHPENRRRIERVKTLIRQKGLRNGPKSPLSF